MKVRKTWRR